VNLTEVSIGDLYLPTGKIVAGDPFFIHDHKPLRLKVKPGNYPVKLLIHKVEENHFRVAFSKILFNNNLPTNWTLAFTEDITDEQIKVLNRKNSSDIE
jgi:hypothetical protein